MPSTNGFSSVRIKHGPEKGRWGLRYYSSGRIYHDDNGLVSFDSKKQAETFRRTLEEELYGRERTLDRSDIFREKALTRQRQQARMATQTKPTMGGSSNANRPMRPMPQRKMDTSPPF